MKRAADEISKEEAQEEDVMDEHDPSEPSAIEVKDSASFWRCQIEAVYRRRNPHKLSNVQALLEKYKDKEAVLYAKVCKAYDLDPRKFYADAKSWEQYETDVQDEPQPAECLHEEDCDADAAAPRTTPALSAGTGVVIPSLFGVTSFDQPQTGVGTGHKFKARARAAEHSEEEEEVCEKKSKSSTPASQPVVVPSLFGVTSFDQPQTGVGHKFKARAVATEGSEEEEEVCGKKSKPSTPASQPEECKMQ